MGTGNLLGKPNKLRGNDLRWTSIPSRGSRNTPRRFMLQKPGISFRSYDPVGSKASFFFSYYSACMQHSSDKIATNIHHLFMSANVLMSAYFVMYMGGTIDNYCTS